MVNRMNINMNIKIQKNRTFFRALSSVILSISILLAPMSVSALNVSNFGSAASQAACSGLSSLDASQSCGSGNGNSTLNNLISTIINILTIIVGIISVIMIIISGMKFITSGGDAQKVSSAKTGLIYALIGLVVVALAQAIVHFVISNATTATK